MPDPVLPKTPPTPEPKPGEGGGADLSAIVRQVVQEVLGDFTKKVDERFEGLSKKTQERFAALEEKKPAANGTPPATEDKPKAKGDPAVADIVASVRAELMLEAAMKGLDETARKRVESIQTDHGVAAALAVAEGLGQGKGSPATGDQTTGASPSTADAATQSPPTTQRFDDYQEWQKFRRSNANAALDYRRTHKTFDPFKLKGAPKKTWETDDDPPAAADSQAQAAQ